MSRPDLRWLVVKLRERALHSLLVPFHKQFGLWTSTPTLAGVSFMSSDETRRRALKTIVETVPIL